MATGITLSKDGRSTRPKGMQWTAEKVDDEPVELSTVQEFVSLFEPTANEWALLTRLTTGVRQMVERQIRRLLVRREATVMWQEVPDTVTLPLPPHGNVLEVRRYTGDGTTEVLDADQWTAKGLDRLTLEVDPRTDDGLEVDFQAGYETLPEGLKMQMLRDIKDRFDQRDSVVEGTVSELPDQSAYDAWRVLS